MKYPSLCESVESLQSAIDALLGIERDAAGIEMQYQAIPGNCRETDGPHALLAKAQGRVDARFWRTLGCAPTPGAWASPDRVRTLLNYVEQLAHACGASLDVSPLAPRVSTLWTSDEELYVDLPGSPVVGGQFPIRRRRFLPKRELTLRDDGSIARLT